MAFTGTAVFETVSDSKVRVTGLSLASAASGVFGLAGSGAEIELPASFQPKTYGGVDLAESIQVDFHLVTAEAVAPALQIVKVASPWSATVTNGGAAASGGLEFYIDFH